MNKRWLPLCLASLLCCCWLPWALPRLHPAARLKLIHDYDGYVDAARKFAAANVMMDLSRWRATAEVETLTDNQELRLMMPNDDMARHFPDAGVHIYLYPPDREGNATFTFRPDTSPMAWKLPMPEEPVKSAQVDQDAAMHELAGADASHYNETIAGSAGPRGSEFKWQMAEHGSNSAHIAIDEVVRYGRVWKADTIYKLPESVAKKIDKFPVTRFTLGCLWTLILVAALVIPVIREGSGRTARAMKEGSAIWLALAAALGIASTIALEWGNQEDNSGFALGVLATVVGGTIMGIPFYAMFSGTALCARLHPLKVRNMRLLGSRWIFTRTVGSELLAGWLGAPVLLALPLVVTAVLGAPAFGGYDDGLFLSRSALFLAATSAAQQATLGIVALFGVMIPLVLRYMNRHQGWRSRRVAPWVGVALAFLTFVTIAAPFREALAANLVWAAIEGSVSVWLYWRFGMLTALSAYAGSKTLNAAAAFLVQPSAVLQGHGFSVLVLFGAFGLVAALIAWKAPEATVELFGESGLKNRARSRREELLAEFNVARSAQQRMLPSRPPSIAGYSLSASCDPAREVGGDLYDFIPLRDGRWGIGVADVSGKGVPAALYMTLTKGLLCAASQDSADPGLILGAVNRHLRTVTKKKMFVTMAFGVLDPETRSMEYARAGHNPVVWRRAAMKETRWLGGAGIGLGIAGAALFAKTLKTETLALEPGDALVFYSDGLTEAMNEELEQFGEDRLAQAVELADGLHAEATRDSILKEVKRFLKGGNSQDDLTIAVLRVD